MAENTNREWKQELSAANGSMLPASEASPAGMKERPGPTGSPQDLERDDANTDRLTTEAASSAVTERGGDIPHTPEAPRPGAAPAWQALDAHERDFQQIEVGWAVFSADGEQLGQVSELGSHWFAVPYGTSDERIMYVPVNFIETIANRRVVLSQPAGLLIDMKLNQPPDQSPEDRQRMSGTDHQPWRGVPGGQSSVPEPLDSPAQAESPASAERADGDRRGVRTGGQV